MLPLIEKLNRLESDHLKQKQLLGLALAQYIGFSLPLDPAESEMSGATKMAVRKAVGEINELVVIDFEKVINDILLIYHSRYANAYPATNDLAFLVAAFQFGLGSPVIDPVYSKENDLRLADMFIVIGKHFQENNITFIA